MLRNIKFSFHRIGLKVETTASKMVPPKKGVSNKNKCANCLEVGQLGVSGFTKFSSMLPRSNVQIGVALCKVLEHKQVR